VHWFAAEAMDAVMVPTSFPDFPYAAGPYPQQLGLMQTAYCALQRGGVALLESPTGLFVCLLFGSFVFVTFLLATAELHIHQLPSLHWEPRFRDRQDHQHHLQRAQG
jgi:hypothetical protein